MASDGASNPAPQSESSGKSGTERDATQNATTASQAQGDEKATTETSRVEASKFYAFFNSTFNAARFGDGSSGGDTSAPFRASAATWASELREIDAKWLSEAAKAQDPRLDELISAWAQRRILIIRYAPGGKRQAELLLQQLAHWSLKGQHARKLLSAGTHVALSFRDLCLPQDWAAERQGSLIYLARRDEAHAAQFFSMSNGAEVKHLNQRLHNADSRLLVSIAAEWDGKEGDLDTLDSCVFTLEIEAQSGPVAEELSLPSPSPFDVVPRLVAGLFPGLRMAEYMELVNEFQPAPEKPAPTSKPSGDKGKEPRSPPPPPNRHERWLKGEIDAVLKELGVRYETAPIDSALGVVENREPGYYLADDASPFANLGWIIGNHPAFLAGRAEGLLLRYLRAKSSERFCESLLPCLSRLHRAGVHVLTAEALVQALRRAAEGESNIDLAARRLVRLAQFLEAWHDDFRLLSRALIEQLAEQAASEEVRFQHELGIEPLQHFLLRLQHADSDPAVSDFWALLSADQPTWTLLRRLSEQQALLIWALLRLGALHASDSCRALTQSMLGVMSDDTPWGEASARADPIRAVPRSLPRNIQHLLNLLVGIAPGLWTVFAKAVVEVYGELSRHAWKRRPHDPLPEGALAGQRLALACCNSLAKALDEQANDDHKLQVLMQLGLVRPDGSCKVTWLGHLLAMSALEVTPQPMLGPLGKAAPRMSDTVRYLRVVAYVMAEGAGLPESRVTEATDSLMAGLRAYLPTLARRELTDCVRTALQSQMETRDRFEAGGDRAAVRSIRRRIRASQALLRSIGADR